MQQIEFIVEPHPDGYVAYPLGIKGIVVGEGDTYDNALRDAVSATRFHVESFGTDVIEMDSPVLEAYVADEFLAAYQWA